MSDSADMASAAQKLNAALANLEAALDPMLSDLNRLRQVESESASFVEDRAKLAQELDNAKAREADMQSRAASYGEREAEFQRLADETTAELDQVIAKVQNVLERD